MIDAHVHVVCADAARYPRARTGADSERWSAGGDIADLVEALDTSCVDHAVVVQAVGAYGYDCRCALDTVTEGGGRFAFVGAVDMDGDDPAEALAELAAASPLAGVRTFAAGVAGSAWLADGRGDAVWGLAAELGVVVEPTISTERLPPLRVLLERHPHAVVALDHCAFLDMAQRRESSDLRHLAELRALHLKVTSHNLYGLDDPAAFLEPLVAAFGPERLAWGSDHPQQPSLSYPAMVELARRASRYLAPHEQAAFLDGTARRLWFGSTPRRPGGRSPSAG